MAQGPIGQVRSVGTVIVLTLVTLGIYGVIWQYKTFKELKNFSGQGLGGGLGLLFALIFPIVNIFMLPAEVGNLYQAAGQQKPISGTTGWWVLIPLVGGIIWLVKIQGSLNTYWAAQSTPATTTA